MFFVFTLLQIPGRITDVHRGLTVIFNERCVCETALHSQVFCTTLHRSQGGGLFLVLFTLAVDS